MPLNDAMLRNLKSDGTAKKLADSEGLYLYLSASGGKLWRMDYRFGGKRKTLSFGAYPAVSLKEARRKRDRAKELLANDIDPGGRKKAAREEAEAAAREQVLTFSVVAGEWFATRHDTYAAANIKKKRWLISLLDERIGDMPIGKLTPSDILGAIRLVEAAGHTVRPARCRHEPQRAVPLPKWYPARLANTMTGEKVYGGVPLLRLLRGASGLGTVWIPTGIGVRLTSPGQRFHIQPREKCLAVWPQPGTARRDLVPPMRGLGASSAFDG